MPISWEKRYFRSLEYHRWGLTYPYLPYLFMPRMQPTIKHIKYEFKMWVRYASTRIPCKSLFFILLDTSSKTNTIVLIVINRNILLQEPVAEDNIDIGWWLMKIGVAVRCTIDGLRRWNQGVGLVDKMKIKHQSTLTPPAMVWGTMYSSGYSLSGVPAMLKVIGFSSLLSHGTRYWPM